MRGKFLRTLVVFVSAFAALFLAVSQDEFREFDAAYVQQEMFKESAENHAAQRNQQAVYFSSGSVAQRGYSPIPAATTPSPTLSAFSTCILRC